jgi:nitric oxide dioxygenase
VLLATAGAGITTALPIVEHIARTQPQRPVVMAHADRTAQDHALQETVLHVGRELDHFTSLTWYEQVAPGDRSAQEGWMDLSEVALPEGVQVFTCGPLPFMRHVRSSLLAPRGAVDEHPLRGLRARPLGAAAGRARAGVSGSGPSAAA